MQEEIKESVSLGLARKYLGKEVEVTMDRPMGSLHPKHNFKYEVNYGCIAGEKAPDGEDLDAYYINNAPLQKAKGICLAVAYRKNNDDDKLVVVPNGVEMSDEEIIQKIHFQEQWFETEIIRQ